MSATPNIELLKRHKASRDAGIITQEEFMEIYHGIMNEGANIQQVSNSLSSSSQSNPTTAAVSILKIPTPTNHNQSVISSSSVSKKPSVLSLVSEDFGPDNKVNIYKKRITSYYYLYYVLFN